MNIDIKELNPNVFRKAARRIATTDEEMDSLVDKDGCACDAILYAAPYGFAENYQDFFESYFHPRRKLEPWDYWWRNPEKSLKDQPARIFALLLAAEILESEQAKK